MKRTPSPQITRHGQINTQNSNPQNGYLGNKNQRKPHVLKAFARKVSKVLSFISCKGEPNSSTLENDVHHHGIEKDFAGKSVCLYVLWMLIMYRYMCLFNYFRPQPMG